METEVMKCFLGQTNNNMNWFIFNGWTWISGFRPTAFVFSVNASYLCLFQEAIQLDGEILFALLRRVSPLAFRHLEKHKIDPILYMTEWFMCAFSRTLPWASVLRVWDMFLCDGNNAFTALQWYQMLCKNFFTLSRSSPSHRSEDYLPCGSGAAEVHAGNPGEAEGLPGPVWDHGAPQGHRAPIHAGGLPRQRGNCRVMRETISFIWMGVEQVTYWQTLTA